MSTDTEIKNFVINTLTKEQFDNIPVKDKTQLYMVKDQDTYATTNLENSTSITNCITEIPQDIKLELKDGILILKAGSKVYNGNGIFGDGVIPTDKSATDNGNRELSYAYGNGQLIPFTQSKTVETKPAQTTGDFTLYYETSTKKCWLAYVSGWIESSFPICQITSDTTGITSIDQVFNGFGYIGSTIYALPGVKGLISDNRNKNGSLKNIEVSLNSVKTYTTSFDFNNQNYFLLTNNATLTQGRADFWLNCYDIADLPNKDYAHAYEEKNNIWYWGNPNTHTWVKDSVGYTIIGNGFVDQTGRITSFNSKTTFHVTDYNEFISELDKKADDSKVVHSTGNEDITGFKRFTSNLLQVCNSYFDITQNTPDKQYINYQFRGKSGKEVGGMYMRQDTNGVTNNTLYVIGRNDKRASIYAQVFADGTRRTCTDCTPQDNADDSQIATTAWVNKNANPLKVGDIIPSLATSRKGALLCNGATVSKTNYPNLFAVIGYQYGGSGDNFVLPDLRDRYIVGAGSTAGFKAYVGHGLPNITGEIDVVKNGKYGSGYSDKALYFVKDWNAGVGSGSGDNWGGRVGFDASRSNGVYGASSTVRPKSIGVNYFIVY